MTSPQGLYDQFTFEKSGLPDNPTIRTAYGLMLKAEIEETPTAYKDIAIQRNIQSARAVADLWSSDPEVISAALLRGTFQRLDGEEPKGLRQALGDRVADLARETAIYEAGEDNLQRYCWWNPDEKKIIYAENLLALTRWNDDLTRIFSTASKGQYADPQYLYQYHNLVAGAENMKQDLLPDGSLAAAIDAALAASGPVNKSISEQSAKFRSGALKVVI